MADEAREIAEEAVDRLRRIGDTYSAVLFGRLEEVEAWACIENILRGPPPEGEIRHYVLADKLAALPSPEPPPSPAELAKRLPPMSPEAAEAVTEMLRVTYELLGESSAAPVPEGVPEDRIVPEGWRVEWVPGPPAQASVDHLDAYPILVPLSDTPHEAEGEQP